MTVRIQDYRARLLRDGLNSPDFNVDGSGIAIEFSYTVPFGFNFYLSSFNFSAELNKVNNAEKFLGENALVNGITIEVIPLQPPGLTRALPVQDDDAPIRKTSDFGVFCGHRFFENNQKKLLMWEWDVVQTTGGRPLLVESGTKIAMYVNDDLTKLKSFRVAVLGIELPEASNENEVLHQVSVTRN